MKKITMGTTRGWLTVAVLGALIGSGPAWAQTPAPLPAPAPAEEAKKEEEKPKTFWEENKLFAYIENSFTANLSGSGRGGINELRLYDNHEGYTFNAAEFNIKKDPSERYPFGYGLVLTAGIDSQKNHSFGIFRDETDAFPFRNTEKFDVEVAYVSGLVPLGSGLTLTVRQEFFRNAAGARTDASDERVFRVRYSRPDITSQGLLPRGKSMDTISASLYYSFF